MSFFFEFRWKILLTLAIFNASFVYVNTLFADNNIGNVDKVSDLNASYSSKCNISSKLSEVLLKTEKKKQEISRIKIGLTGLIAGDDALTPNDQYLEILKNLELNSREGEHLVRRTIKFCDYIDAELENLSIPYEKKLRLQLRVEEIKSAAEKYGALVNKPIIKFNSKTSSVLDVNSKLNVVILSAGFLDGVNTGFEWSIGSAKKTLVKVVAVRPYLSAAIVTKGKIVDINPGMLAKLLKH
ncbi:MAG: hypothetical protein GY756_04920 [bacterium]|nr:hypothetical protein [bacterium]